jgi:DNA-binding protein HU-beta
VNKAELIEAVAKRCDLSKKDASSAIDATFDEIRKSVKREAVNIVGFGSWQVSKRKARTGRNPQTGEAIKIKASKGVRFRPGKAFKESL